ncbi:MAG: aspartate/glutamate racemase family protein [Candidatus Aminicenantaceae bacterium]
MKSNSLKVRLGLIIPSSNTTAEPEFAQMAAAHPQITFHTSRIKLEEVTPSALNEMATNLKQAALLLADASVDGICLACTSGSFIGGRNGINNLKNIIELATDIPSITTSECVVMALKAIKARHLAILTPYIPELNSLEVQFLEESMPELEVVSVEGFNLTSNLEIGRVPAERIIKASRFLMKKLNADTLFLSCTNMPSAQLLQSLEDEAGIPVISSNSASLYGLQKLLNHSVKIKHFGKLLSLE